MKALEKLIGTKAARNCVGNSLALSARELGITITPPSGQVFSLPPGFKTMEVSEVPRSTTKRELDREHVEYLARFMAVGDVRYYLNGLALYPSGAMCCTDGHTLAAYADAAHPIEGAAEIIPGAFIDLAVKLHKKIPTITLGFTEAPQGLGWVSFYHQGYEFSTRLIDGRFPNITQVIPTAGDPVEFAGVPKGLSAKVKKATGFKKWVTYAQGATYGAHIVPDVPADEMPHFNRCAQDVAAVLAYEGVTIPPLFDRPISRAVPPSRSASKGTPHQLGNGFNLAYLERCKSGPGLVNKDGTLRVDHDGGLLSIVMGCRANVSKEY